MGKFKCAICGKGYDDVNEYLDCVKECTEKYLVTAQKEDERRKEISQALDKIKAAKEYHDTLMKNFKEDYPDAYEMNFGKAHKVEEKVEDFKEDLKKACDKMPKIKVYTSEDMKGDDFIGAILDFIGK